MSTLKTKKVQLGDNADPSKNFLIDWESENVNS